MKRTHFYKFLESKAEKFNLTSSFWCKIWAKFHFSDLSRTLDRCLVNYIMRATLPKVGWIWERDG